MDQPLLNDLIVETYLLICKCFVCSSVFLFLLLLLGGGGGGVKHIVVCYGFFLFFVVCLLLLFCSVYYRLEVTVPVGWALNTNN